MTRTQTALVILCLAVIAAAGAIKIIYFPSVSDKYFQVNTAQLEKVPVGLAVVRPTHFGNGHPQNRIGYATVNGIDRMAGLNNSFLILIATAYSQNPGRITLPWDAPTNHFDFLITISGDPRKNLQSAIRRQLGYTADLETNDTPVLDLKVEDPNSPGLKISPDDERENREVTNGRLYFTHEHLTIVTGGLEEIFRLPVVDKTDLTNYYDFSLVWNQQMQTEFRNGTIDADTGKKILAEWGLGVEEDSAPVQMLVVKKVE